MNTVIVSCLVGPTEMGRNGVDIRPSRRNGAARRCSDPVLHHWKIWAITEI